MTLDRLFLDCSIANLRKYTERIAVSVGKLDAAQIWTRGTERENAVGNLVLHLCGNVRQWIVAGVGRQPDTRDRDAEFDARGGMPPAELVARLRETVEQAVECHFFFFAADFFLAGLFFFAATFFVAFLLAVFFVVFLADAFFVAKIESPLSGSITLI